MRSNNINRHMKVHVIYTSPEDQNENNEQMCQDIVVEIVDEVFTQEESATEINDDGEHDSKSTTKRKLTNDGNNTTTKIKCNAINNDALRKTMEEETAEYDRKINLGKRVEEILGEGKTKQAALSKDLKEALDIYRNDYDDFDLYKNTVLYPWQESLLKYMKPSDREVIWIVGEKTNEGKSYFQKYVKAMYGTSRVVSGINLKASSKNICHALSKHPLATADIFLFNLGKSLKNYEEVNYEMLEDLKDGDAFTEKYDSHKLKIKTPNVVMVFSNYNPKGKELATDRWQVFHIVNEELEEREGKNFVYSYDFIKKENNKGKSKHSAPYGDKKKNHSEAVEEKKLSSKELQKIEDEICLNLCFCGYHKCEKDDKFNMLMGVDVKYLRKVKYDRDIEKIYKCEECPFDSTEMEDVKNHFMLIHREHFMYKCWECEDKMKTISELKTHYAKFHLHKLNEPHYYPPYNI